MIFDCISFKKSYQDLKLTQQMQDFAWLSGMAFHLLVLSAKFGCELLKFRLDSSDHFKAN